MVNCSTRTIIVRWADLSDFFSLIFVGKMCVFVSRPMKIVIFLRKNSDLPKWVVTFLRERGTFRKTMEIVEDFIEQSFSNNGKHWKSSRILCVKTKPPKSSEISHVFFIFLEFSSFIFSCFHFSSFFGLFFICHHFPHFSRWSFIVSSFFLQFFSFFLVFFILFIFSFFLLFFFWVFLCVSFFFFAFGCALIHFFILSFFHFSIFFYFFFSFFSFFHFPLVVHVFLSFLFCLFQFSCFSSSFSSSFFSFFSRPSRRPNPQKIIQGGQGV